MIFLTSMMNATPFKLQIQEKVSLAPYTTLGVGGLAQYFAVIDRPEKIPPAMEFARLQHCPIFILGGGSNIVVADAGFCGLVLKIEIPGIRHIDADTQTVRLSAGAGVEWDVFVQYCVEHNLAGVECLSGIPGTVGGVPIQNAGAYGQEAGEVITKVETWDRESGTMALLNKAHCGFSYRSSIFNTSQSDRYIILSVEFELRSGGNPCIQYSDLKQKFSDERQNPTLRQVREAVLEIRQSKGMVVREEDPDSKSAGSFFKNPILKPSAFAHMDENIPRYPTPEGNIKLPAAWLIEHAGFSKGYTYGCAGLSRKHSLALINRGGATAKDIVDLMIEIQDRVQDAFGIKLHPEPVFIGFEKESKEKE